MYFMLHKNRCYQEMHNFDPTSSTLHFSFFSFFSQKMKGSTTGVNQIKRLLLTSYVPRQFEGLRVIRRTLTTTEKANDPPVFPDAVKVKFPWKTSESINIPPETFKDSFLRFIYFRFQQKLTKKDFLRGSLTAYRASTDAIFSYCQQIQQLLNDDPSLKDSLADNPKLGKEKEQLQRVIGNPFVDAVIKQIHKYYAANPNAEVFYKLEEASKDPIKIEEQKEVGENEAKTFKISINKVPPPTARLLASAAQITGAATENPEEKAIFSKFLKNTFPEISQHYEARQQNQEDTSRDIIRISRMSIDVGIGCVETFYIKDKVTNDILLGSTRNSLVKHVVSEYRSALSLRLLSEFLFNHCHRSRWI